MSEVIVNASEIEAAVFVARYIANRIKDNPNIVLGLATGSTPLKIYQELAKIIKSESIDISNVKGFSLDEYVGLDKRHPESYFSVIDKYVTKQIGFNPDFIHVPDGSTDTIAENSEKYEKMIKNAGGIDIQILGIGTDGHIGFNEPGSSLSSRTRIKTLTQQTREDNSRFFNNINEVPTHCITQGIGTIMQAKHILLFAFGTHKAEAIKQTVEGGISSFCPASVLQMHPKTTIILDDASASKLQNLQYYKWAFEHKPAWQGI